MAKKRFTLVIEDSLNQFLENEKWNCHLSKNQLIVNILSEYAVKHSDNSKNFKPTIKYNESIERKR